MALLDTPRRQNIQEVVDRWRERCLIDDGSLLYEDERLWTHENLARVYHNAIEVRSRMSAPSSRSSANSLRAIGR